jgi:hypothetical protein
VERISLRSPLRTYRPAHHGGLRGASQDLGTFT